MNMWPDAGMTPFRNEENSNWEGAYRVPAMVRWPGKIKAGSISNENMSHMDWLPTLAAAAGDSDVTGKPVGIQMHIGRRPIASFGNSDGDLQMLQWTAAGKGTRLLLVIHHTDAKREWAYDRQSSIGHLDTALDEAHDKGWTVVDMKQDWKVIFPFQRQ